MASTPDPSNIEKVKKDLKEIAELYKKLGQNNPFKNADPQKISESADEMQKLEDLIDGLTEKVENYNATIGESYNTWKNIINEVKGTNYALRLNNQIVSTSADISRKLRDIQSGINVLNEQDVKELKKKLESKKQDLISQNSILQTKQQDLKEEEKIFSKRLRSNVIGSKAYERNQKKLEEIRSEQEKINQSLKVNNDLLQKGGLYDEEINKAQELADRHKEINKELGFAPQLAGGLDKTLQKLGLPDLGINQALEDTKEMAMVAKSQGKEFNTLSHFVGNVKDNLAASLTKVNLMQAGIGMFIKAIVEGDKATGDMAKSMNITYDQALGVREELTNIASTSLDASLNTNNLQETLITINKEFGTSAMLNKENLKVYTSLREQAGMTNEEIMGIAKFTEATGGDAKKNVNAFQAGAKAVSFQKNVTLDTKTLMADIGKLSKSQLLIYKDSAGALGNMMARVKATGIEMSKLESIAEGLLNFEQSIENELSAELLTGKELNLEKARSFALDDKMADMAEELTKQGITSASFAKMNRLEKEATAKALGMTTDDLAEQLMMQDTLNKIGKGKGLNEEEKKAFEYAKSKYGVAQATKMLEEGQLDKMKQEQSIQDRLANSVLKMQEIFVSMAEPVLAFLSPIMDLANTILPGVMIALNPLIEGFKFVSKLVGGIISIVTKFKPLLIALGIALIPFAAQALISAAGMIMTAFSWIPVVGPALGAAFILGTFGGLISTVKGLVKGNDVMSPGDGSSGYGKRTLLGPEGAIQLNNKDTVIAGTKLFDKGDDVTSEPGKAVEKLPEGAIKIEKKADPVKGGAVDMTQTNALLQEMINLIQAGSVIQMDSQKVGQALRLGTRQIQ